MFATPGTRCFGHLKLLPSFDHPGSIKRPVSSRCVYAASPLLPSQRKHFTRCDRRAIWASASSSSLHSTILGARSSTSMIFFLFNGFTMTSSSTRIWSLRVRRFWDGYNPVSMSQTSNVPSALMGPTVARCPARSVLSTVSRNRSVFPSASAVVLTVSCIVLKVPGVGGIIAASPTSRTSPAPRSRDRDTGARRGRGRRPSGSLRR